MLIMLIHFHAFLYANDSFYAATIISTFSINIKILDLTNLILIELRVMLNWKWPSMGRYDTDLVVRIKSFFHLSQNTLQIIVSNKLP